MGKRVNTCVVPISDYELIVTRDSANMTPNITTKLIYGYSVNSQNPSERAELPILPGFEAPDRENIGMHMDAGKACVETRGALWTDRWLLPTNEFNAHCAAVHEYAGWFVRLRLQRG